MGLDKKLTDIQNELKAPKNLYNTFGKYKYRNLESILEGVKPLLKKQDCSLVLSDDVLGVGNRIYIVAEAVLKDNETGEEIRVRAMARESEFKKGMDDSQITGTASSYARKYCLNGLFLIDDTKDADTDEYQNQQAKQPETPRLTQKEITAFTNLLNKKGKTLSEMLKQVGYKDCAITELTPDAYNAIVRKLMS